MTTHAHPVRINTRLVLRIYAWTAFSAGVAAVLFGPWPVGPDPAGVPWVRAAAIRQIGALMIVAGCFSLPLANVDDPEDRRRGLLWFAIGHAVLAVPGMDGDAPDPARRALDVALARRVDPLCRRHAVVDGLDVRRGR